LSTGKQEADMAGSSRKSRARGPGASGDPTAQAVRDSAQKIWLAGLGAFERARTEGPRMFETLVEQGRNMGARAVGAADDVLKTVRQGDYSGRWDKLEQVFEDRVSRSLQRLGVLTSREVDGLAQQVRDLNEHVRELMSGRGTGGKAAGGTRKKASAKRSRKAPAGRSKAKAKAGTKSKTSKAAARKPGAARGSPRSRGSRTRS
jgi:poly(hydroxyalkanoate) granule-associated protein